MKTRYDNGNDKNATSISTDMSKSTSTPKMKKKNEKDDYMKL